jgi:hypothetical protein
MMNTSGQQKQQSKCSHKVWQCCHKAKFSPGDLSKKNSENIQNQYYLNHATTENITAEYFPNINAKVEIDATT